MVLLLSSLSSKAPGIIGDAGGGQDMPAMRGRGSYRVRWEMALNGRAQVVGTRSKVRVWRSDPLTSYDYQAINIVVTVEATISSFIIVMSQSLERVSLLVVSIHVYLCTAHLKQVAG